MKLLPWNFFILFTFAICFLKDGECKRTRLIYLLPDLKQILSVAEPEIGLWCPPQYITLHKSLKNLITRHVTVIPKNDKAYENVKNFLIWERNTPNKRIPRKLKDINNILKNKYEFEEVAWIENFRQLLRWLNAEHPINSPAWYLHRSPKYQDLLHIVNKHVKRGVIPSELLAELPPIDEPPNEKVDEAINGKYTKIFCADGENYDNYNLYRTFVLYFVDLTPANKIKFIYFDQNPNNNKFYDTLTLLREAYSGFVLDEYDDNIEIGTLHTP